MSDNFDELVPWINRISKQLSPNERRTLNRRIATKVRTNWKRRIKAQKDPDGRSFTPRKRDQPGSIRSGAMFKRLPKLMKTAYSSSHAEIGFAGRSAEVMRVHQFGQTIKPSEDSKPTRYAIRETVGWSNEDKQLIVDTIKDYLLEV